MTEIRTLHMRCKNLALITGDKACSVLMFVFFIVSLFCFHYCLLEYHRNVRAERGSILNHAQSETGDTAAVTTNSRTGINENNTGIDYRSESATFLTRNNIPMIVHETTYVPVTAPAPFCQGL